jgi:hypothetical protein
MSGNKTNGGRVPGAFNQRSCVLLSAMYRYTRQVLPTLVNTGFEAHTRYQVRVLLNEGTSNDGFSGTYRDPVYCRCIPH